MLSQFLTSVEILQPFKEKKRSEAAIMFVCAPVNDIVPRKIVFLE